MNFEKTSIDGLEIISNANFKDERGTFLKIFGEKIADSCNFHIKQVNYSHNNNLGTIRGLHYQSQVPDAKIVTCLRGSIFDVAVDLRPNSSSFGRHITIHLSQQNAKAVYIPKGFAHGFQTLSDNADLLYLHDEDYQPNFQKGLSVFSEELSIRWPLSVTEISQKDSNLEHFINDRGNYFHEM